MTWIGSWLIVLLHIIIAYFLYFEFTLCFSPDQPKIISCRLGGTFCFLTSIFGVAFLSIIATLIKNDYKYVGEWYDKDDTEVGIPTKEMKDDASQTLLATAGVYGIFAVLSVVCITVGSRRK